MQRASAAADRFERRLFAEYDDDPVGIDSDGDAYGMPCAQRGQGQREEFESRCVSLNGYITAATRKPAYRAENYGTIAG